MLERSVDKKAAILLWIKRRIGGLIKFSICSYVRFIWPWIFIPQIVSSLHRLRHPQWTTKLSNKKHDYLERNCFLDALFQCWFLDTIVALYMKIKPATINLCIGARDEGRGDNRICMVRTANRSFQHFWKLLSHSNEEDYYIHDDGIA